MFKSPGSPTGTGWAIVAKWNSDLLAEIERDVLDESKSVAAALRKCLALGGLAKSAELGVHAKSPTRRLTIETTYGI